MADFHNHKIRRVEVATGAVTTLAEGGGAGGADGVGDAEQFYFPRSISVSPDGTALFVTYDENDKIRRVELATGEVTTIAGSGTMGTADGVGDAAEFCGPGGLALRLPQNSTPPAGGGGDWRGDDGRGQWHRGQR